ncbi:helicase conserved C-terminal domain protein [Striga asiatica]|uniref:Helicase conserved C-terminal domain protein n=1 Tax=Striga asiatica TaxID=4170 RepID=A0A5A7P5L1_STRAF|nr:helicase conserved C-terminal domain protein [Striga asiatica]
MVGFSSREITSSYMENCIALPKGVQLTTILLTQRRTSLDGTLAAAVSLVQMGLLRCYRALGEARVRFTGVSDAVRDGVRLAGGVVSSTGDSVELVRGCFDVAGARFGLTGGCFDLTGGCLEVAGDREVLADCFAMVVGFGIAGEAFGCDDEAATSDDFRWPLDLSTV